MIVVVSDTHLGTEHLGPGYANRDEFVEFLEFLLDELVPDHLVLNGDIEDLWRRDMRTVTRVDYDVFGLFRQLQKRGVDVHYVLGNHDWYARHDVGLGDPSFYATNYTGVLTLEDQGTSYTFMHGHQFDPVQDEWYFDKLAIISDDALGEKFSHIWALYSQSDSVLAAGKTTVRLVYDRLTGGPWRERIAKMDRCETDCNATAQLRTAREFAIQELDTDVICTGHTHRAALAADGTAANSGAWIGSQNTYLVLEDTPRLMDWNDGDPVERTDHVTV